MNRVRLLCATTLLTVVLAASPTLAGEMPQGVTSQPPTPTLAGNMPTGVTSTSSSEASMTGEMPQGVTSAIDPMTAFTLNLLQSLLALF